MIGKKSQTQLLQIARLTLEEHLKTSKIPKLDIKESLLQNKGGAFVTLKKNNQLRGCIGRMESNLPLYQTIQKMAAAAANDPRFPPLQLNELQDIKIEISLLSPLKKIKDINEIEMDKHGVMVKKGWRTGVFLAQVARETGWNKETFLSYLCSQKAGLSPNAWQKKAVEIFIFEAQVFKEE